MQVRFFVLPLPITRDPTRIRALLHQSLQTQVGEHQLLRWAITSVGDPEAHTMTLEVVVTIPGELSC